MRLWEPANMQHGLRRRMHTGETSKMFNPLSQRMQTILQLRRKLPKYSWTEMPWRLRAKVPQRAASAMQEPQSAKLCQSTQTSVQNSARIQLQACNIQSSERSAEKRVPKTTSCWCRWVGNPTQVLMPHHWKASLQHTFRKDLWEWAERAMHNNLQEGMWAWAKGKVYNGVYSRVQAFIPLWTGLEWVQSNFLK